VQSTSLAKVRLAGLSARENGVSLVNFIPSVKGSSLSLHFLLGSNVATQHKLKHIGHLVDALQRQNDSDEVFSKLVSIEWSQWSRCLP
jgi:hypothetical protein